jgi:hypothetical protein
MKMVTSMKTCPSMTRETMMWSDAAILTAGAACLVAGAIIGVLAMYGWLLKNSNGVDDEDWTR